MDKRGKYVKTFSYLWINFGCLAFHFTSTGKGTVNFTTEQSLTEVDCGTFLNFTLMKVRDKYSGRIN